MSLRTALLPQSARGYKNPVDERSAPDEIRSTSTGKGFTSHDAALDDGPPPIRIPHFFRIGLSGWNSISQWATPQMADGLGGLGGQFVNLPPVTIPRPSATRGANPLTGIAGASRLRVPSVFVPVVGK